MNCPQCGYLMAAFDAVCPKCHGRGLNPQKAITPSPKPPNPPVQPPNSNAIQPTTTSVPTPVNAAPRQSPSKLVLACPVCQGDNVQKVSVVHEAGTQRSTSRGTTSGRAAGLGYAGGLGFVPVVGVSSSKTRTDHSSQTNLAYTLKPPGKLPHPAPPPKPQPPTLETVPSDTSGVFITLLWAAWGLPGFIFAIFGYRPALNFGGLLFLLSVGPFFGCLVYYAIDFVNSVRYSFAAQRRFSAEMATWYMQSSQLLAEWRQSEAKWRERCDALDEVSREEMASWKRLFYCHRCDHVYFPETGESAPASEMESILST